MWGSAVGGGEEIKPGVSPGPFGGQVPDDLVSSGAGGPADEVDEFGADGRAAGVPGRVSAHHHPMEVGIQRTPTEANVLDKGDDASAQPARARDLSTQQCLFNRSAHETTRPAETTAVCAF